MLIADSGSVTHPVFLPEILTIVFDLVLIICFTQLAHLSSSSLHLSSNVAREGSGLYQLPIIWVWWCVLGPQDHCYNDLFYEERKMGEPDIYILIITSRCFCEGGWVVFTNISYGSWCYTGRMAYNTSKLYISSLACLIFISNYTLLCKSYKYQTPDSTEKLLRLEQLLGSHVRIFI